MAFFIFEFFSLPPIKSTHAIVVGLCINIATDEANKFIETMIHGVKLSFITHMPFTKDRCCVTRRFHRFGKSPFFVANTTHVIWMLGVGIDDHVTTAALLITSGHECRTGRAADYAIGVEVCELHTFDCHAIYAGGLKVFVIKAADASPSHIIDHDDNDIRFCGIRKKW